MIVMFTFAGIILPVMWTTTHCYAGFCRNETGTMTSYTSQDAFASMSKTSSSLCVVMWVDEQRNLIWYEYQLDNVTSCFATQSNQPETVVIFHWIKQYSTMYVCYKPRSLLT